MTHSNTRTAKRRFASLIGALVLSVTAAGANAGETAIKQGQFSGLSDHITTGGVSVVKGNNGLSVKLAKNFSLDGAPDAKVGFGRDGVYDIKTQLAPLASLTGEQTYQIPASLNIEGYNEVYIWCEQFSVPLGVAKIQ